MTTKTAQYVAKVGSYSPWGQIDHVTRYSDDIHFVSTPNHGGFLVTGPTLERLERMHDGAQYILRYNSRYFSPKILEHATELVTGKR